MDPPSQRLAVPDAWGTSRVSRLFPGSWLAHADLHNHTWLSDGAGDPRLAFGSMRSAGLDVAALTDHSRWASAFLNVRKAPGWTGIDARAWPRRPTTTAGSWPCTASSGRTPPTAT
jgi:hypothetical protein